MMKHNNILPPLTGSAAVDEHALLAHSNSYSPTPRTSVSLYLCIDCYV